MGNILTQTGGSGATGDLTNAIGNARLSVLCPNISNGTVSTATVSAVIVDTEAQVLSILGPAFNVSASSAVVSKSVVIAHAKKIGVYNCYCRVTEFRNDRGMPIVEPDYVKAVGALEKIATGDRDMGDETGTAKSALVSGVVNFSTSTFIVEANEATTGPVGGF